MATITRTLSRKIDGNGKSEILLRLSIGRGKQFRIRSGIFIKPGRLVNGKIKWTRATPKEMGELRETETALHELEKKIYGFCQSADSSMMSADRINAGLKEITGGGGGADSIRHLMERYLTSKKISTSAIKQNRTLTDALCRFERYRRITGNPDYRFTPSTVSAADLSDFESYLRDEVTIYEEHPEIFTDCYRHPEPRGTNTINGLMRLLRTFFRWCLLNGLTTEYPFRGYTIPAANYGTPYYITLAERDTIENADLSARPALEVQRDVFIFQCYLGCRVSDLYRLTRDNIVNGAIEYIPRKTKEERPEVVRVPLHPRASAIIERYRLRASASLLPLISQQKYNEAIKEIFTLCGITRPVTVINPTTGAEERRPINEIASSHLARRTFVGNLYKQVKDPNLIGKLSGHKEGSRAFARYRDIDEEMKRDLIDLLG